MKIHFGGIVKKSKFGDMRTSWLIVFFLVFSTLTAQEDSVRLVQYHPEFRFNDGLYLHFGQVRNNNPVSPLRISSNEDPLDFNFFRNLVKNDLVSYFDDFGTRITTKSKDIWGYCQDGKIFIQFNGEFNRLPIIGSVGHFIADVTVTTSQYDPYYHRDYYDYYYNPYHYRPSNRTTRSREMRQYLIDFESGSVVSYDLDAVKAILINEPDLYSEFAALRKKQQKELMFFFIRRYNEKKPLTIPVR